MKFCLTNKERAAHLNDIAHFFNQLPKFAIDQAKGELCAWSPEVLVQEDECGACVGAWLAMFYKRWRAPVVEDGEVGCYFYKDGAYELGQALQYTDMSVDCMLEAHGAPEYPFSERPWHKRPADVFRSAAEELAQIQD